MREHFKRLPTIKGTISHANRPMGQACNINSTLYFSEPPAYQVVICYFTVISLISFTPVSMNSHFGVSFITILWS